MREILFRGQTRRYGEKVRMGDGEKLPGRWVYGGVLQGIGDFSIIYGGENPNDPSEGLDKWAVYTDTLGQYTGLTDRKGKKIFEGDRVVYPDSTSYSSYDDYNEGVVDYDEEAMRFYFTDRWSVEMEDFDVVDGVMVDVEVIGNIHDNPDLLEVHHE